MSSFEELATKFKILGDDNRFFQSTTPGTLGGHRGSFIYGVLDCPAVLRALATEVYFDHRVLFLDEASAVTGGYRAYGVCRRGT